MTAAEWVNEGLRRAEEGGGTITLTRREWEEIKQVAGNSRTPGFVFLGYPVVFAKPYDWANA